MAVSSSSRPPHDKQPQYALCRAVVRDMMVQYEWRLVPEEDLVDRVLAEDPDSATRSRLKTLAMQEYTLILYEACRQEDDRTRKEQAFSELHRFLYRTALRKWPYQAEDLAQQALVLVYEQFEACRKPAAFLRFALFKLRQAETRWIRALEKARAEAEGELLAESSAGEESSSPNLQVMEEEQLQVLLQAISQLPDRRQQGVILLKYFGGLSDAEIATRLDITANHVRVLRNRGMARLRKDDRLRQYFVEDDREGREPPGSNPVI